MYGTELPENGGAVCDSVLPLRTMIVGFLTDAARRGPGRTAVVSGNRVASYADLECAVRRDALRLLRQGIAVGDRVALLEENTPGFLITTFSVAWVGAVLQPLNTRLSLSELEAVLRDADTRLLVAGTAFEPFAAQLAERLPSLRILSAPSLSDDPERESAPLPDPIPRDPSDLAHLYYTSGTTGHPKGVCLTHGNLAAHAQHVVDELVLRSTDRWGHFAPMFHLADAWATLALTLVGGVHVMQPRFEANAALDTIERDAVSLTNLVPTMLTRLIAVAEERAFDPGSLRLVLSGGAPVTPALVRRILSTFRCEYVQTYGMTETSPYLTLGLLGEEQRGLSEEQRLAYIARTGRPFAGVSLEVVDDAGREVPRDDRTVGEIRVRGASVSPGYWRRPAETAQAFRDGWLYTGDLAVIEEHGFVNIVDRRKDMILTGGENVYSTEVENLLAEHPSVLEVAAFARPDPDLGERVAAAVVLRDGTDLSPEDLRSWCEGRIARYKTPREIHIRDRLPRMGSGKISKRELRQEIEAETPPNA